MFLVPPKDRTIRSDKRRTLKERRFRGRNAHSGKCRAILYLRLESEIDSVSRGSPCFILHATSAKTSRNEFPPAPRPETSWETRANRREEDAIDEFG